MATNTWAIDPSHSEIQFKVKHLVITTVTGHFEEFSGAVEAEEGFENASISFEANTASINTKSEQRDGHLKSADFFDVEQFPTLSFKSTSFVKDGSDFELKGDLTIKDVTKTLELDTEFIGIHNYDGQQKASLEVTAKIKRSDFDLWYNNNYHHSGISIGQDIKLVANLEFEILKN